MYWNKLLGTYRLECNAVVCLIVMTASAELARDPCSLWGKQFNKDSIGTPAAAAEPPDLPE